ncbi:MAG: TlpA family protein disulfide reductase [Bacteroidales bacterium]|nr:TlpA family protein disulfide reductase [Bacteroidales bacterium]
MIRLILTSLISSVFFISQATAQFTYQWMNHDIFVKSNIELRSSNGSNGFHLEGNGISIDFATLGGMEGISGLAPSLDTYASAFGYKTSGKAREIWDVKTMAVARLDGQRGDRNMILCLMASKDFKKHFTCEILFSEDQRINVESIIKGISFGSGSAYENTVSNEQNNDVIKTDDNNQVTVDEGNEDVAQPNDNHKSSIEVGSFAPDFTLNDINGKSLNLSSFKGKILLLDFWGTWCGPCIQSIPKLKELYGKYGGSKFEIISIANDVNASKWKSTVLAKDMKWSNVMDQNEKVCKLYQVKAYPSLFLVDKNGKFVAIQTSDYEVEEYLKQNGSTTSNQSTQVTHGYNQPQQETENVINNEAVTNNHLTGTPVQMLTWQLLSTYSPDGYFILDEYYKSPTEYGGQSQSGDDDFTKWIDGQSEEDIVKSLNTVVHEMDHGFTGRVYLKLLKEANKPVEDGGYSSFYLGNKEARLVRHTDVFVTKEINSVYPSNLVTSRYQTYVYPSEPIMGSQQSGVYGLLDEWNAYYNGTRTSFDLYNYYKEKRNDASGWSEFFSDYYGTYYAYLEFKSYIIVYMMYAKNNYPQIYQGFMGNSDLLYSLKKTDEIWKSLIVNFKSVRTKIMKDLISRGMEVEEKDGFIFINGSGTGNFSETYNKFQEELKKPEYQEIAHALGFEYAGGPEF